MKRRFRSLPVVLLAAALALSACGGGGSTENSSSDGKGSAGGTVTLGAYLEPVSLDMTSQTGAAIPQVLLYNVYEGLVRIDATSNEVVPLLAKDWKVSDDGTVYTFTLRDAKFHDGQDFTAKDVVWSFERVTAEGSANPFKTQMAVVSKVEAPDDKTVVVTLERPSQFWLRDVATQVGIVLKEGAENLDTKPNGTGPFKFVSWNRGDSITLERNDDYWGDKAKVDKAVFRYITDANALNNAMLSGQLDIIANVQAPQLLEVFKGNDQFKVVEGSTTNEIVLGMNNETGPFADPKVRKAVRHAIDHKALIDTVWSGHGTAIGSMVPPTDPWYEDRTGDFAYDPEAAKKLLAEAGHAGGLSVTMDVPPPGYARSAAQFVASQLAEVGIQVKQNNLEFPQWLDKVMGQANYEMTIIGHVEPLDIVRYGEPSYYWRYDNPKVTQLIKEGDSARDEATRDGKLAEAAKVISDDAASDWLFLLPNLEVIRKGVEGFPENALTQSHDLTKVQKNG